MFYSLKPTDASKTVKATTRYFGVGGQLENDGPNTLAKVITKGNASRCFCKCNTYGVEAGHLVNPWSMYAEETPNFTNAVNAHTGRPVHEYREVNETVCLLYVKYLQSRSDLHYRQAERMLLENV